MSVRSSRLPLASMLSNTSANCVMAASPLPGFRLRKDPLLEPLRGIFLGAGLREPSPAVLDLDLLPLGHRGQVPARARAHDLRELLQLLDLLLRARANLRELEAVPERQDHAVVHEALDLAGLPAVRDEGSLKLGALGARASRVAPLGPAVEQHPHMDLLRFLELRVLLRGELRLLLAKLGEALAGRAAAVVELLPAQQVLARVLLPEPGPIDVSLDGLDLLEEFLREPLHPQHPLLDLGHLGLAGVLGLLVVG